MAADGKVAHCRFDLCVADGWQQAIGPVAPCVCHVISTSPWFPSGLPGLVFLYVRQDLVEGAKKVRSSDLAAAVAVEALEEPKAEVSSARAVSLHNPHRHRNLGAGNTKRTQAPTVHGTL
eukprot:scaffold388_cov244-Pinguiococcus_pyrenoidosus.AAC.9